MRFCHIHLSHSTGSAVLVSVKQNKRHCEDQHQVMISLQQTKAHKDSIKFYVICYIDGSSLISLNLCAISVSTQERLKRLHRISFWWHHSDCKCVCVRVYVPCEFFAVIKTHHENARTHRERASRFRKTTSMEKWSTSTWIICYLGCGNEIERMITFLTNENPRLCAKIYGFWTCV